MNQITAAQLQEAAGVSGVNTLNLWVKEGLIPGPIDVVKNPNGRGTIRVWEEFVLDRVRRISQQRKEGKSNAEIREFLRSNWDEERERYEDRKNRRLGFKEVSEILDRQAAIEFLWEVIDDAVVGWERELREMSRSEQPSLLRNAVFDHCVQLLKDGIRPVLVVDDGRIFVTGDIAVGLYLAKRTGFKQGILVVPLLDTIAKLQPRLIDLLDKACVDPVAAVVEKRGASTFELQISTIGDWGFELGGKQDAARAVKGKSSTSTRKTKTAKKAAKKTTARKSTKRKKSR